MRIRPVAIGAAVCAAAALTACGSTSSATSGASAGPSLSAGAVQSAGAVTPPDAGTLAAAEKEGTLLVYGNPNDDQVKPLLAGFQAKYPSIKASYISLGGAETFQRYLSEQATGGRTADALLSSDGAGWLDLVQRKQVLDYAEPNVPALPKYAVLAPGVFAMSEDPTVAVFNKALLPEAQQPTTLAGLADLAAGPLKGKIATYTISDSFGYAANQAYLAHTGEPGWAVLDKLGKGTASESGAAGIVTKLTQGQYTASYFVSGAVRFAITGATAQVLNYKYLTDATPLLARGLGVTKGAGSPNAAKVFVNYVLSTEGQDAACKGGFTPYRAGVTCPVSVDSLTKTFGADNIILGAFDPALVASKPTITSRWNTAFGR